MTGHDERRHRNAQRAAKTAEANAIKRHREEQRALDEALAPVARMKGRIDERRLERIAKRSGTIDVFRLGYLAALCDVKDKLDDKIVVSVSEMDTWAKFAHSISEHGRSAYGGT